MSRHTQQGRPRLDDLSFEAVRGLDRPEPPVLGSAEECWCGLPGDHGWPDKEREAPHPSPFREFESLVQEAARRVNEATEHAIALAAQKADALGWGVLVLTENGVALKCGPSPEVPAGEVHWRSA